MDNRHIAKMQQAVEDATNDFARYPDVALNLEIAEKMYGNNKLCRAAIARIQTILKCGKGNRTLLALNLVEVCSKNGSLYLHKLLSTQVFMETMLKLLKRRRGKAGLMAKFENKDKKRVWFDVEEKALYLIQLWSDTFMLHEDDFPFF